MRVSEMVARLAVVVLVLGAFVSVTSGPGAAVPPVDDARATAISSRLAAPPTIAGCRPISYGRPTTFSDQLGRYLQARLRYRCPSRKYYTIFGTIYRVSDTSNAEGFLSDIQEGTSSRPSFFLGAGRCRSVAPRRYRVVYDIKIGSSSAPVYYQTPSVRLRCRR